MNYPLKVPAIKIEQPLGIFFVTSLTAETLLEVCYTVDVKLLEKRNSEKETLFGNIIDNITGTQRERSEKRLEEIKRYSETVDASFPNSIILGANYSAEGLLNDNDDERWYVEESNNGCFSLIIPSPKKLASVIDGQHRVFGFNESKAKSMSLVCSVFLDLPIPYHAQIFTTINMNQKKVDKNLAYNLFQFDMDVGERSSWSPDTLSVYYTRLLSQDEDSPLYNKLKLGLPNQESTSSISMACVIDGILSLLTTNPKHDREILHTVKLQDGRNRSLLKDINSSSPLRYHYIHNQDKFIYELILDYFNAIRNTLWKNNKGTIFHKTLGIQALFDFLKEVLKSKGENFQYTQEYFESLFKSLINFNFEIDFFGIQTKLRSRIKNTLLISSEIKNIRTIENNYNSDDLKIIRDLLCKINIESN